MDKLLRQLQDLNVRAEQGSLRIPTEAYLAQLVAEDEGPGRFQRNLGVREFQVVFRVEGEGKLKGELDIPVGPFDWREPAPLQSFAFTLDPATAKSCSRADIAMNPSIRTASSPGSTGRILTATKRSILDWRAW